MVLTFMICICAEEPMNCILCGFVILAVKILCINIVNTFFNELAENAGCCSSFVNFRTNFCVSY